MNAFDYERMMVEAAGGLNAVKPVVQIDKASAPDHSAYVVAELQKRSRRAYKVAAAFIVQNDLSFREAFEEMVFRRGGVLRIVG